MATIRDCSLFMATEGGRVVFRVGVYSRIEGGGGETFGICCFNPSVTVLHIHVIDLCFENTIP